MECLSYVGSGQPTYYIIFRLLYKLQPALPEPRPQIEEGQMKSLLDPNELPNEK